ncbi:MAG: type II toxin-antitoxin system ParD family antitoxin [Erythrobacter sp.]|nr:MAG: type II toxin-antitoxin system ParD family antitoxin [Erythrobacter sp.]
MSKLERMTVTLPEEMAAKLREAVANGEYVTTSEIVREALREWSDLQERRLASLTHLRAMVQEGLASELLDGRSALAELREKYRVPPE